MDTTADIEALKRLHGKITTVTVPLDEDSEKVAVFHLKRPTKETRKMIQKLSASEVPERAVIAGFKALSVGGDDPSILEENYEAALSAEGALIELLTVQKATIKKN